MFGFFCFVLFVCLFFVSLGRGEAKCVLSKQTKTAKTNYRLSTYDNKDSLMFVPLNSLWGIVLTGRSLTQAFVVLVSSYQPSLTDPVLLTGCQYLRSD